MTNVEPSRHQHDLTPDSMPDNTPAVDNPVEASPDLGANNTTPAVDRVALAKLEKARARVSLIIHGPTPEQSFQATVTDAIADLQELFKNLPAHLNAPDSPNTANGVLDTEPVVSDPEGRLEQQLLQFRQTCQSMATQFKARFFQVQSAGADVVNLARGLEPPEVSDALEKNFLLLTTDLHNAGKLFDAISNLPTDFLSTSSPQAIVEQMLPDGIESVFKGVPIRDFDADSRWSAEQLLTLFGCSEEAVQFEPVQDTRFQPIFAGPELESSIARYAAGRGVLGDVRTTKEFRNSLVPAIVIDAVDIVVDNAGDELLRDGMRERLLQYGTAGKVSIEGEVEDNMMVINIKDNAFGLAESVIEAWGTSEQVTTKHAASDYQRTGTGIGLNQVLDIIHAVGGTTEIVTGKKEEDLTALIRDTDGTFRKETRPQSRWPVHGTTISFRVPMVVAGGLSGDFTEADTDGQ